MEKLDVLIEKVAKFISSNESASRLILKSKSAVVREEFLKKLFETVEKVDVSYDTLWLNRENEAISIREARMVNDFLSYEPSQARRRYVISEEFSNTSREAVAALLKITEEPPDFAVFLFFTSNPMKILSTIRSRFTIFPLNVKPTTFLSSNLAKKIKNEELFSICNSDPTAAFYVSNEENLKKVEDVLSHSVDTFSTLEMIKENACENKENEGIPMFMISVLAEKLLLFLKKSELTMVFGEIKELLSSQKSLELLKVFFDAAIIILQDLTVLKKTSFWKGIKRKGYVEQYLKMKAPDADTIDWVFKIRNKLNDSKINAEVSVFLLLSKFLLLKERTKGK